MYFAVENKKNKLKKNVCASDIRLRTMLIENE
jgi:hypothetical protein